MSERAGYSIRDQVTDFEHRCAAFGRHPDTPKGKEPVDFSTLAAILATSGSELLFRDMLGLGLPVASGKLSGGMPDKDKPEAISRAVSGLRFNLCEVRAWIERGRMHIR